MKQTVLPLFEKTGILKALKQKYNLTYVLEVVPKFYAINEKPILSPLKEVVDFCSTTDTLLNIDYYLFVDNDKNNE